MMRDHDLRQIELHRQDRAKYNLVHPTLGTITKERADQLWAERDKWDNTVWPTREEDEIIRFLWSQLIGSASFMTAFFVFLNQEKTS